MQAEPRGRQCCFCAEGAAAVGASAFVGSSSGAFERSDECSRREAITPEPRAPAPPSAELGASATPSRALSLSPGDAGADNAAAARSVAATLASTRRGKAALLRFGEGLWLLSATKSFTRGAFAWRDERASRDRLGRRLLRTTGRSNASYGARYRLRREAITLTPRTSAPAQDGLQAPRTKLGSLSRRSSRLRFPRVSESAARAVRARPRGRHLNTTRTGQAMNFSVTTAGASGRNEDEKSRSIDGYLWS